MRYRVKCLKCTPHSCLLKCDKETDFHPAQTGLMSLSVTVLKLKPYSKYKFIVFSSNGVTKQAKKESSAEQTIRTYESGKVQLNDSISLTLSLFI